MGAAKLDHVLHWCTALGIPAVTLWVCSTKNLQRPAEEVSGILAAIQEKLAALRSEEHTSVLQSLMRNSYAVFCLKTQKNAALKYAHISPNLPRSGRRTSL